MYKNKFSKNAIEAINHAINILQKLSDNVLNVEHLFMGILKVKNGVAAKILASIGVDPEATLNSIEAELISEHKNYNLDQKINEKVDLENSLEDITLSVDVKEVFNWAYKHAVSLDHNYVGTEHLLLGILGLKNNYFVKELNKVGLTFDRIKGELESFVQYPGFFNSLLEKNDQNLLNIDFLGFKDSSPNSSNMVHGKSSGNSFLENFGRNLTMDARMGKLDPVIGRIEEINRIMEILARRKKNNPILLGDPGVGKTAIVEGLAQKLISTEVSPLLSNLEIWAIDTALFLAGSQLRGDLESKVLELIKEVEQRGNVVLFIDEIHTIVGAGATSSNPMDIGNILKPALAKGTLRCIGATTVEEYRKYFDEDPALQRRFQPVEINELSEKETYELLKNIKSSYEKFHNVRISDSAIRSAVNLTSRYITDRFLPDKAIDVIDEACARKKLEKIKWNEEFKSKIEELKVTLVKKEDAYRNNAFDEASILLEKQEKLMNELNKIENKLRKQWKSKSNIVTEKDIKKIVAKWAKMPSSELDRSVSEEISKLEKDLYKNIIGQDYANQVVLNSIKRAKAGLEGFDRPLASFLFIGPTGVGKTELAKQLAKTLFGTKDALIQIDMSELMEYHSVSKLIGAPPGYIGYEKEGLLTAKVRRRPFSVVLFDEIEKADPEVLNILLQILDEGKLTDSKGKIVNFKNTIIIMTSNLGSEFILSDNRMGLYFNDNNEDYLELNTKESDIKEKIINELKEYLSPEFINRIDDIVIFRSLSKKDVYNITKLNLQRLISRLRKNNKVNIQGLLNKKIINYIVSFAYSQEYGAREVRKVIKTLLEDKIAEKLIELNWLPTHNSKSKYLNLSVGFDEDKIMVSVIDTVAKLEQKRNKLFKEELVSTKIVSKKN